MKKIIKFFLLLSFVNFTIEYNVSLQNQTDLVEFQSKLQNIRRIKRSLNFPTGSAFVMTMSVVKVLPIKGFTWNQVHEFDVIWPIPNKSDKPEPKPKPIPKYPKRKKYYQRPYWRNRIHRRELYSNFEMALERFNLPGKICILRTICEARTFLHPPGVSLIEDMFRVILSNPIITKKSMDEYDLAHQAKKDCHLLYPCPFSLLDLILNYNNYIHN